MKRWDHKKIFRLGKVKIEKWATKGKKNLTEAKMKTNLTLNIQNTVSVQRNGKFPVPKSAPLQSGTADLSNQT